MSGTNWSLRSREMENIALACQHVDTLIGEFRELFPRVLLFYLSSLIFVLIVFSLKAKLVDVEYSYIYQNIELEIFIECSPGMIDSEDMTVLNSVKNRLKCWRYCQKIVKKGPHNMWTIT